MSYSSIVTRYFCFVTGQVWLPVYQLSSTKTEIDDSWQKLWSPTFLEDLVQIYSQTQSDNYYRNFELQ